MTGDARKDPAPSFRSWFLGLLLISGLIVFVSRFAELERFAELLRSAEPTWLLLALVLQGATYVSVACLWYLALRLGGSPLPLASLIPLSIAKLFSDQAIPSAGMSGTAFFIAALGRRGVAAPLCMAALLLSVIAYYGAYLAAALGSILLLWLQHAIRPWVIAIVVVFCLIAIGIPLGALWLRRVAGGELPRPLSRIPGLSVFVSTVATAPDALLRNRALVLVGCLLHATVFALDAATLWVVLQVVGVSTSFWVVFPSFIVASMVATIGPVPLGFGTFELTSVSMLSLLHVPVEAALTATLLLRGFTLWLPMLPGMWMARRALR